MRKMISNESKINLIEINKPLLHSVIQTYERWNDEKFTPFEEEGGAVSSRQPNALETQINENNSKIALIGPQIASSSSFGSDRSIDKFDNKSGLHVNHWQYKILGITQLLHF